MNKEKGGKIAGGMAQVVAHLPKQAQALSSTPSTAKINKIK
jgi:hypothetical protein